MNDEDKGDVMLAAIGNTAELRASIKRLERKRILMEGELRDKFHEMLEGFKPTNILKNTLHEVQESTTLKHNILKVALGLGAGYFSRKLMVGQSAGFVKKALGAALQFGITTFIAKKDDSEEPVLNRRKNIFRRILSL